MTVLLQNFQWSGNCPQSVFPSTLFIIFPPNFSPNLMKVIGLQHIYGNKTTSASWLQWLSWVTSLSTKSVRKVFFILWSLSTQHALERSSPPPFMQQGRKKENRGYLLETFPSCHQIHSVGHARVHSNFRLIVFPALGGFIYCLQFGVMWPRSFFKKKREAYSNKLVCINHISNCYISMHSFKLYQFYITRVCQVQCPFYSVSHNPLHTDGFFFKLRAATCFFSCYFWFLEVFFQPKS